MIKRREGCSRRGGGRDVINSRDGGRRVQRERETISCCLPSETDSVSDENKTSIDVSLSRYKYLNRSHQSYLKIFIYIYIYIKHRGFLKINLEKTRIKRIIRVDESRRREEKETSLHFIVIDRQNEGS